jgi:hypothetical protein
MSPRDSEFWTRARRARDELEDRFMGHPDVTLIDIGNAPDRAEGNEQIVLRIHVRRRWMETDPAQRVAFPKEVAGIPVVVVPEEFRLD